MIIKLNNLGSSNIESINYNESEQLLFVEFHSGGVYKYSGVPREVFDAMSNAESVGKAFHNIIRKGGYAYEKVGDSIDTMNV